MQQLIGICLGLAFCMFYTRVAVHYNWWPFNKKGRIDPNDLIVEAISEWVDLHPDEATEPIKSAEVAPNVFKMVSLLEILEGMEANSDFGKEEYKKLIQLTVHLLHKGKIGTGVESE